MPVKADTTQKVIVIGAGVTLRDASENTAKSVGVLSFGDIIGYVGQNEKWSKVVTQDNVEGWVLTVFLNLFNPAKKEAIFLKVVQNKFASSQQSFGNLVEIVNFIKKLEANNLAGSQLLTLKNKALKQSFKIIPSDKTDQSPYSEWLLAYNKKPLADKKIEKNKISQNNETINVNQPTKKYALGIGNSSYDKKPLKNPVNDANDIATALGKIGFEVTLRLNMDIANMQKEIVTFYKNIESGSLVVFYYAGHAVQMNGENYLLPINTLKKITSANSLPINSVNLNFILMNFKRNSVNMLILDSCRNSPFNKIPEISSGLARNSALKIDQKLSGNNLKSENKDMDGILIAYATSPGAVASDGGKNERNSPYTKSLLQFIKNKNTRVEKVLKNTRNKVTELTNGKQTPWYESSINEDLYLAGKNSIEFIDLLKTYIPEEGTEAYLFDWRIGASEYSPIKWATKGLDTESYDTTWGAMRKGSVIITNEGIPSHFKLEETVVPVEWKVEILGSFGMDLGFHTLRLSNDISIAGEGDEGSIKIDKKYILDAIFLCKYGYATDEKIIKLENIKIPNKRVAWLMSDMYCGGIKRLCSYKYTLFLNLPEKIEEEADVKECIKSRAIYRKIEREMQNESRLAR